MTAYTVSVATSETFDRAIRGMLPALRGFAHRLTRDHSQSEDLVQETLLRAWSARERFIPDSNLKGWLFRIEYNCFVSTLRKSRRTVQLSPEMAEIRLTAPAMQEEGLMMRDLALALAALPEEQATTLALVNDEVSYDDAAERLGVPLGTIKSRAARGRAAIGRFLSGDSPGRAAPPLPITSQESRAQPASNSAPPMSERSLYAEWKASGQRMIG